MTNYNDVAKATLQQFNAAYKKIEARNEQIENYQKIIDETTEAAAQNREARNKIKELKELNDKDREFVKQAIDFYEDITGEAVGVGDLFNQTNEGE